jgi:predicted naringenin-chalcone synthase
MPSVAAVVATDLALRRDVDLIPLAGMGCIGGGHAIARACEYVRARPAHTVLLVAADVASPWFFVERERRDTALRGSVVSASLFSDGAAAAVMSMPGRTGGDGFGIVDTASFSVPGTADAIAWEVRDDGLHFTLPDQGVKSIPAIAPALEGLVARRGWGVADLAPATLHTGGNRIIDDIQKHLALSDWHMQPTRDCLRKGNTMSVAVLEALELVATKPEFRPCHGTPGIGAGYGPGFATAGFSWTFHEER